MTDTTLQHTITSTLLPPDPTIALKEQIAKHKIELHDLRYQLSVAKSRPELPAAYNVVLQDLVASARGDEWHESFDQDALKIRLHELVKEDTDECWSPERRFDITITYITTVQLVGYAKDEDAMREYAVDNVPDLKLGPNYSTLEVEDFTYNLDDLQID